jgi:acylphosphatase
MDRAKYNHAFQHMRIARRFLISGRVQGVGFRWFTKDAATREGVRGWVRNLPDGRVEAWAEGDPDSVIRLEAALRLGPRGARVENVYAIEEDGPDGHDGFSIK